MNIDKESCRLEHYPCREAKRSDVYKNARKCKLLTIKRCKSDPTKKKSCETAKKGISRLRKGELCAYIVGNPLYRTEGHILKKQMKEEELRRNLSHSIEPQLFSPLEIEMTEERRKGSIGDVQRTLYLARFSGNDTVVYEEPGGSKVYWTIYDEDEEQYLDD